MRVLAGPTRSNQVLAWSPDGRWLVAGGSGNGVTVWDVDGNVSGRRLFADAHGGKLMRFCRGNGCLYVAFQSGGFRDWNPDTDEERRHPWSNRYSQVHGLAVDQGGELAVVNVVRGGRHRLRNEDVGYFVGPDGRTSEAWARPSGRDWDRSHSFVFRSGTDELFGVGSRGGETQFLRVRTRSGDVVGSLQLPFGAHQALTHWALSPDGDRVAYLLNRALCVCEIESGAPPLELPAADGEHRRGLAWSPDGRVLAYATGTTVRLLDSATLNEVRALDWNIGKPRAVAFNPDGLRAAVSGDGGRGWVNVFDLE